MNFKKIFTRRTGFIIAFLLPAIFLFTVIYLYPLLMIIGTSFSEWNSKNFASPKFLGFAHLFDNYIKMFTEDTNFLIALKNTCIWILLTLVVQVPFALWSSLVLSKKLFLWKFTRNVFIIPNIISAAAIGLIFYNLYNPKQGVLTEIVNIIKPGSNINLFMNPRMSFLGVTFAFILFAGSSCLLLMTQIASIDTSIYEAAKIDGASSSQIDYLITIPLLRPMLATVSIMAANYGLLLYNEIALITKGGPGNNTYSISYYVYKTALGSTKLNFARGNAAGVIQIIMGIIIIGFLTKVFRAGEGE